MGADMVVGSLIKNPGGGLAPIGGYICGTTGSCVDRCAYRLSCPGPRPGGGRQSGPARQLSIRGCFWLPQSWPPVLIKGAIFAANVL